jgi:hypothetical protein
VSYLISTIHRVGRNSIIIYNSIFIPTVYTVGICRVGRNSIIIYNSIFIPTVYTVGIWQNQMNLAQNIRSSFLYGR